MSATVFILVGGLYVLCVFVGTILWVIGIYKNARVRQFALDQLDGQLVLPTSDDQEKKQRRATIKFLFNEVRLLDNAMAAAAFSPDINKAGIDLVSVYILRARLGIRTEVFAKLLAKASFKIIEKYIEHLDDVKEQVQVKAAHFGSIDRQFIVQRFVSNLFEMNQLVEPSAPLQPKAEFEETN